MSGPFELPGTAPSVCSSLAELVAVCPSCFGVSVDIALTQCPSCVRELLVRPVVGSRRTAVATACPVGVD